jgi:hypothetical protein
MEKKVVIKSDNGRAKMVFVYNENENLIGFHLTGEYNKRQEEFILVNIAEVYTYAGIKAFCNAKGIKGQGLTGGLEFEDFWDKYNYKDGSKVKSKELWAKLKMHERVLAMEYLTEYHKILQTNPSRAKLLPETYLSKRRWENAN